jgi:hypothetical protein
MPEAEIEHCSELNAQNRRNANTGGKDMKDVLWKNVQKFAGLQEFFKLF